MTKKKMLRLKCQSGFTLTELLVATGLSLFVLASIGGVFRAQTHTVKGQESRMEAHEYALTVLDIMVREIRNAGYFPIATCAGGGITAATPTSITIQYDRTNSTGGISGLADGDCNDAEEAVTFTFAGSNVTRTANSTTNVLTDGNATNLQFTYYPQQTSGTAPAPYCVSPGVPSGCSDPLNLNLVKKIVVSLTVQPRSTDSQFTGSAVTMSATADLRNHGLL